MSLHEVFFVKEIASLVNFLKFEYVSSNFWQSCCCGDLKIASYLTDMDEIHRIIFEAMILAMIRGKVFRKIRYDHLVVIQSQKIMPKQHVQRTRSAI